MRKSTLRFAALLLVMVIPLQASAAKIVFDPTNFGRNVITAGQSVQQTARMVMQHKTMIDQYATMLRNVKNMSPAQVSILVTRGVSQGIITGTGYPATDANAAYNEAMGVYGTYTQLYGTMRGLGEAYDGLSAYTTRMNRMSAASGLSWDTMLAAELRAAKAGQTASSQQYQSLQNLTSQIGNFQQRADQLATQIPKNQGALEALSTLSAQNHLMTDQMSGLLQASVAQAQIATINQREQAFEREKAVETDTEAERRRKEINKYFNVKSTDAAPSTTPSANQATQ